MPFPLQEMEAVKAKTLGRSRRGEVNPTLRKSPFVIHFCQRHFRFGGVHQKNLLIVTELKLCVQGVNNWNWAVCLLEGNRDQKPGIGTRKETEEG